MSSVIQVAGKSDIYIGYPSAPSTLILLGEQMNDTRATVNHYKTGVFADSHGGQEGPPVEKQILGMTQTIDFTLSKWDEEVYEEIQKHAIFTTPGKVEDSEPGTLILKDNYYRICINPTKSNVNATLGYDPFFRNLVCCEISDAIAIGQGTKHSILNFSVTAHRAPKEHPKEDFIWDRDATGVPVP